MATKTPEDDKSGSKPGGAHSPRPEKDKPKKSPDSKDDSKRVPGTRGLSYNLEGDETGGQRPTDD